MHSSSGPLYVFPVLVVSIQHSLLPLSSSKTSPSPSTYDAPGKAYANLVNATGGSTGTASLSCLRQLPLDVSV